MILFFLKAEIVCVTGSIMSCNFLKFVSLLSSVEAKWTRMSWGGGCFLSSVLHNRRLCLLKTPQITATLTVLIPSQERVLCLPAIWREKVKVYIEVVYFFFRKRTWIPWISCLHFYVVFHIIMLIKMYK